MIAASREVPLLSLLLTACSPSPPHALRQEAYIWQRDWTPEVVRAVEQRGSHFERLLPLTLELEGEAGLRASQVPLDWEALAEPELGLVLRSARCPGPEQPGIGEALERAALQSMERARAAGKSLAELQLDIDCPRSQLGGYADWLQQLAPSLDGLPLSITTLPDWLGSPSFLSLVQPLESYVLQVHWLPHPEDPDALPSLMDPEQTRAWVGEAGRLDHPFRVALPTYGYQLGFSEEGDWEGIAAEGRSLSTPVRRELRSDPLEAAALVREWTAQRPASMQGLIWFRLPVEGDQRAWGWGTLEAVMQGREVEPQPELVIQGDPDEGLWTVEISNQGGADWSLEDLVIDWGGVEEPRLRDGHRGWRWSASCLRAPERVLRPGEREVIAWFRAPAGVRGDDVVLAPGSCGALLPALPGSAESPRP